MDEPYILSRKENKIYQIIHAVFSPLIYQSIFSVYGLGVKGNLANPSKQK